jgi:hypothetical protein
MTNDIFVAILAFMKSLFLTLLAALLLTGCAGQTEKPPDTNSVLYFPETGHSIQPPFSTYFQQRGGARLLGYPITEALDHEGWRVQYFQNARLEVHPENSPDYFITVGWLGELSNRTQPPIPKPPDESSRYFPESGHSLSGDFLTFFEANGGTAQFGRPISEAFLCSGFICQDFQSARFIWRPQLPPANRVQLEALGEGYFLNSDLPVELLAPVSPPEESPQGGS